jgi:hypothetical protein
MEEWKGLSTEVKDQYRTNPILKRPAEVVTEPVDADDTSWQLATGNWQLASWVIRWTEEVKLS